MAKRNSKSTASKAIEQKDVPSVDATPETPAATEKEAKTVDSKEEAEPGKSEVGGDTVEAATETTENVEQEEQTELEPKPAIEVKVEEVPPAVVEPAKQEKTAVAGEQGLAPAEPEEVVAEPTIEDMMELAISEDRNLFVRLTVEAPNYNTVDKRVPGKPLRFVDSVAVTDDPNQVAYARMIGWGVSLIPETESNRIAENLAVEALAIRQRRPDESLSNQALALSFGKTEAAKLRQLCVANHLSVAGNKAAMWGRLVARGVISPVKDEKETVPTA